MSRQTTVSIVGDAFHINRQPTYPGRTWRGHRIEGLLLNSRMVQATFDDLNPETRPWWNYPDGPWDAQRNLREFLEALPVYRQHGLLAITVNFQGGSPRGYSKEQPWHNSAFEPDGSLRDDYAGRMKAVIDRCDELGMVVIVGYFYFGQDHRLTDEKAVIRATEHATDWLLAQGYTNVIVEVANECNIRYTHPIILSPRNHELVELVAQRSAGKLSTPAGRLLVGTSMSGSRIPTPEIVAASDVILIHGNGVKEPDKICDMVDQCRALPTFRGQPVVFNEDDHFDFDKPQNNMIAAVSKYASWGYFDYRIGEEGFEQGYQSVPVDWAINSQRKRGFFNLVAQMTGAAT
jgi:hypothetical protein